MKKNDFYQWYFYRFRLKDDYDKPKWWLDLYLIDRLVRKILDNKNPNFKIELWRFHRRNGKDIAGHQFTFLCYTNKETSEKIDNFVKKSGPYKILSNNNILNTYFIEDGGVCIDGSGDRHWPQEIAESWPYFIKGACEAIIEMLKLMTMTYWLLDEPVDILNIEEVYKKVDERLEYIWYFHGGHSFLHHLNALFGYNKLKTTQQIVTSF